MSKVTLETIAKKCGVSKGLVSLALAGEYGVSAKKRSDIVVAALQLGYDFQRLRRRKNDDQGRLIVVLVKTIDLQTDRFWPQIIKGIEREAAAIHARISVRSWSETADPMALIPEILDAGCVGILIVSELPPERFEPLAALRIPMVLIDGKQRADDHLDTVSVNNYAAMRLAVSELIRRGAKRLVFVGDVSHADSFNQRFLGFRDALAFHPGIEGVFLTQPAGPTSLTDCLDWDALCADLDHRSPTVYVCANDFIAEFVYRAASASGRRIPEEVGVFGFDDISSASTMIPPLSTVVVPKTALGQKAVQVLLDRITDREAPFSRTELMAFPRWRDSVSEEKRRVRPFKESV